MTQHRRLARLLTAALLVAAVAQPLAGCGKKAAPQPPEDSVYPRTYPAP